MLEPCIVEIVPPFTQWDWHIFWDEDINDPLPQILREDGVPYNLSGRGVTVYIRPTHDHSTLIKSLSTASEIIIDDMINGLMTVRLPRATVQAQIPAGVWTFHMVMNESGFYYEWGRGPFIVHPGRTNI